MEVQIQNFFTNQLLEYYRKNKRDLPWRDTKDPYKIWISEVILQQTQVKQGLDYYLKFIKKFPNVKSLANAKEEEILHLWQGLGYYTRARNLHYAAQQIINEFNGNIPTEYDKLITIKGIGHYTAAAIASFAFDLPYAVVDGNVYRVLSRFFGIHIPIDSNQGKKLFSELAQSLLPKEHSSEYNQAIMEFGATYCKPQNPDCMNCLLNRHCQAFIQNKVSQLPFKSKKVKKKNRFLNYIIFIEKEKFTYIFKRTQSDIWNGLFEFYLIENNSKLLSPRQIKEELFKKNFYAHYIKILDKQQHVLTHQNLFIQFVIVKTNTTLSLPHSKRVFLNNVKKYPFPVVIQKFISNKLSSH